MATISYEDWKNSDAPIAIGQTLMGGLSAAQQVARAAAVLDVCHSHWSIVPELERVATIAIDPTRWREGHDAFTAVRHLTLKEGRSPTSDVLRTLLYVAEIVAKIIYNASNSPAPFDHDSPWWLANNAREFARARNDEAVTRELWNALTA